MDPAAFGKLRGAIDERKYNEVIKIAIKKVGACWATWQSIKDDSKIMTMDGKHQMCTTHNGNMLMYTATLVDNVCV